MNPLMESQQLPPLTSLTHGSGLDVVHNVLRPLQDDDHTRHLEIDEQIEETSENTHLQLNLPKDHEHMPLRYLQSEHLQFATVGQLLDFPHSLHSMHSNIQTEQQEQPHEEESIFLTGSDELAKLRFAISLTEMLMRQQERKLREFPETKDETKAIPITPKRRGRARKRKRKDEDGDLVNLNGGYCEEGEVINVSLNQQGQSVQPPEEHVKDPKLRSNSFYGRRDTLIKCIKKFRNDFPECDAMVFGNWRLQDNSVKPWPADLSDFGVRQIETIISYLDHRYKFPPDDSVWERYKNDVTDTRRAKLSKKRHVFGRKVSELAALGNNDIFFLFLYPTKEYKDINIISSCWMDCKAVEKPYALLHDFLKRIEEHKNKVYNLQAEQFTKEDVELQNMVQLQKQLGEIPEEPKGEEEIVHDNLHAVIHSSSTPFTSSHFPVLSAYSHTSSAFATTVGSEYQTADTRSFVAQRPYDPTREVSEH